MRGCHPAPPVDFLTHLPRRLVRGVLVWSAILLTGHVLLHLVWRFRNAPKPLRDLFAFASEDSLVTWTSVAVTIALAIACVALGVLKNERGWKLTGLFFAYLSLDDEAMLHERLSWLSGVEDGVSFSWTFVVLPVMALFGLAVFVHIWRASTTSRSARRRTVAAYGMWAGALGLEGVERALVHSGERWRGFPVHLYQQLAEEWLEMVAPCVLLAAVLTLIGDVARAQIAERDTFERPPDERLRDERP
ncbi:hypothetical protein Pla163_23300 [Planctomycetes bacterium Pla163]|uniref:Uncharacterized protein n=1 Tax=Rohdeia mirabilis TaxID=2528008 RepID=A0A518D137_9BACT|nr:hypothetical protein Pla163_23300 [Planctomycetes bacterium Pla163]